MTSDTASDGSIVVETGISKIDDIFITGQILNGEDELRVLSQISIYPNPATDIINFKTELPIEAEIYNLNGKKLLVKAIEGKESIHISQLKSGIYLVKMADPKSNTHITRTIVKQ